MNELLQLAITAHGGLERWNRLNTVSVEASITGGIWYLKGRPDILKNVVMDVSLHTEKLVMSFPGTDKRTTFEADRIIIEGLDDSPPKTYQHPITAFEGHVRETPWEDVHVAYFSGEALWTYLTTPFLYSYPGFVTEEMGPWHENDEVWRRLKIVFPDNITSHSKEQVSYFGPDGLIRRHDYTVDILGGATGANYATGYRNVDGIIIPTTRRIYAYEGPDHMVIKDPLLVGIDMQRITFS